MFSLVLEKQREVNYNADWRIGPPPNQSPSSHLRWSDKIENFPKTGAGFIILTKHQSKISTCMPTPSQTDQYQYLIWYCNEKVRAHPIKVQRVCPHHPQPGKDWFGHWRNICILEYIKYLHELQIWFVCIILQYFQYFCNTFAVIFNIFAIFLPISNEVTCKHCRARASKSWLQPLGPQCDPAI